MKLLSLDGGGVFGIYQAHILDNVDVTKFDAVIGTSIGSANAIKVAFDSDVSLIDFFHVYMSKIFRGRWYRKFDLFPPRYNDRHLNRAIKSLADDYILKDARIPYFATAVNVSTQRLKVFSSASMEDNMLPVRKIVRYSSAAPTYFSPKDGYVDGGLYVNQCSAVGVVAVSKLLGHNINDIEVCSIGTGSHQNDSHLNSHSYFSWGKWILNATLNGASNSMHDYITNAMPLKRFVRVQVERDADWSMDDVTDMYRAEKRWEDSISRGIDIVNDFLGA